jgi:hypothetical protein
MIASTAPGYFAASPWLRMDPKECPIRTVALGTPMEPVGAVFNEGVYFGEDGKFEGELAFEAGYSDEISVGFRRAQMVEIGSGRVRYGTYGEDFPVPRRL